MASKYAPTRSNLVVRRARPIFASDEEQRAATPFRGVIEAMGPLLTGPAGRDSDPKIGSEIVFTLYTTLERGPGYDLLLVNFADVQAVVTDATDEGPKFDPDLPCTTVIHHWRHGLRTCNCGGATRSGDLSNWRVEFGRKIEADSASAGEP